MSKKYSVFIAALFCVFIFGFGIASLILPDREFSDQENRFLTQFKAPTAATLVSGKFMENFEDYTVDQFPLRDQWIKLKAACERLVGKQQNNGVYFSTDKQTLFAQYTRPSPADLATRVNYVNKLAEKLDVPVYFGLIPDKSYVWADRLPANAPLVDDGSVIEEAEKLCSDKVNWIDLSGALSGDDVFYRTDHHWSTMGAMQGYMALAQAMKGTYTVPENDLQLMSDSFYGTTYSSSGAGWVKPDSIYTIVPEDDFRVSFYPNDKPVPGELYVDSKLEVKDKYAMFLGGNQPLCVIENLKGGEGRLLVIRDSYSDSLAPFLAQDYEQVHLFDLRYNRTSLKDYVAEHEIDTVLVLYSNANFATDGNLFLMGI